MPAELVDKQAVCDPDAPLTGAAVLKPPAAVHDEPLYSLQTAEADPSYPPIAKPAGSVPHPPDDFIV